jgi:hypothetical protein
MTDLWPFSLFNNIFHCFSIRFYRSHQLGHWDRSVSSPPITTSIVSIGKSGFAREEGMFFADLHSMD